MTNWTKATYLDQAGYDLTMASTPDAAFGLGHIQPDNNIVMALVVNRASDPTALRQSGWATRQTALGALRAAGTLDSTFGANADDYARLTAMLKAASVTILGADQGYVSSETSRTVWVSLTASQFSAMFGTERKIGTTAIAQGTVAAGTRVAYWDGALSPGAALQSVLSGIWVPSAIRPAADAGTDTGVSLADGPQGIGNSANGKQSLFPNQLAG
ncbi:MAG: hypothetical protein ACRYFY_14350, partial [Janthinobacterium lividum]